jgi:hypothetical protein
MPFEEMSVILHIVTPTKVGVHGLSQIHLHLFC